MRPRRLFSLKLAPLFLLFFLTGNTVLAASFSDVPSDNPYYAAVESLKNLEVVSGYSDGTFKPDQSVNRAEALKMVLLTDSIKVSQGLYATGFPDVKLSDWFSGYVFNAQNLHIVAGNPDGTFAPGRLVNKAEFLKMAELAFQIDLSSFKSRSIQLSNDLTNQQVWYFPYFNYAKSLGIISPTIQDNLEPSKNLSRGECAEILYHMYIVKNGGQAQQLLSIAEAKLVDAMVQINLGDLSSALARAQEAVFYTGNAVKQEPNSNVTQGADLMAKGFQKLFEAYGAAAQKDKTQAAALVKEAEDDADQAVAQDSSLQGLSGKLKNLGDALLKSAA
jgi:hypothetical protein